MKCTECACMRIYLDSNVLISHLREEIGWGFRPLFLEAEAFFDEVRKKQHIIIISRLFLEEVQTKTFLTGNEIILRLDEMQLTHERWNKNSIPFEKHIKAGIHYKDAVHIANAIDSHCDAIATFNLKDFEPANNEIRILNPISVI